VGKKVVAAAGIILGMGQWRRDEIGIHGRLELLAQAKSMQ
jgi:hypothetical protein